MRKSWVFVYPAIGLLFWLLLLQITTAGQDEDASIYANGAEENSYLSVVFAPENTPTPTSTATPTATLTPTPTATATKTPLPPPFVNGSFEDCIQGDGKCEWPTIPGGELGAGNQPPLTGWDLSMLPPGADLYDSSDEVTGVCECVHKEQPHDLPPHEWLDGPNAIILEGKVTYKLFGNSIWGSELTQSVDLPPGSNWRLTVPIQVHLHEDGDPYAAESSARVNGKPENNWANGFAMGDHNWCKHEILFTVPENGRADISIRVKSKWPSAKGKDFFIDDISLKPAGESTPHQDMDLCIDGQARLQTGRIPKAVNSWLDRIIGR